MGVTIRHLSQILNEVEARTKLLITLSDGKPDDYDSYRGAYGIEDTRQALIEANEQTLRTTRRGVFAGGDAVTGPATLIEAMGEDELVISRKNFNNTYALAVRREMAEELAFPYLDLRPGQKEIIDEVATALAQGEQLLVEAPTGLGKTVAALYPAIRYALAEEKRADRLQSVASRSAINSK